MYTCIVPACDAAVPHRDFICAPHWALVTKDRRWKVKHFAELYRVFLGMALDDVAAHKRAPEPTASPDTAEDHVAYGTAIPHEPLGAKAPTTTRSDANRDSLSSNRSVI